MLSLSDTAGISSVMLTSNCAPAQSKGVLVALLEEHWQAPLEQPVQTAHTRCACGCHAGPGLRLGRSRTRPERTLRPELKCTEVTNDTVERS
jgi:hypothetical protein